MPECGRKRALEKHVNRQARARAYSEALESEPKGAEGSQMHACKTARSLDSAIEEEAVAAGLKPEQISTEHMAVEYSAVKIRGLDAQRAAREREAEWKILRKRWRSPKSGAERRELKVGNVTGLKFHELKVLIGEALPSNYQDWLINELAGGGTRLRGVDG